MWAKSVPMATAPMAVNGRRPSLIHAPHSLPISTCSQYNSVNPALRWPPEMAITLNGVAQGYITDRIAHLLAQYGFEDILIDVGEIRAHGHRADGRQWTAAVADPRASQPADQHLLSVQLGKPSPALATSSGFGSPFHSTTKPGQLPGFHHLLNPHTGHSSAQYHSDSVSAPNAMLADGLYTALTVMPEDPALALLTDWAHTQAWLLDAKGHIIKMGTHRQTKETTA